MLSYIDLRYKPSKDDVVCEFYTEPNNITFKEAAEQLAAESSIGTWTTVQTMKRRIANQLKPHVFHINEKTKTCRIAYPIELFEPGNMPSILSGIAGNIFGMGLIKCLRLHDIHFPKGIVASFKGPRYGIDGIRRLLEVHHRPLVGTIIKPKMGLNSKEHAKVAFEAWVGGLDIVKDDENLTSQSFNSFEKRIRLTLKARDRAERITGEKKIYMANITAETNEMLRRAKYVKDHGGEYVMLDMITIGFSALQTVRDNTDLVLHAHRAMHGALTRNPKHGISMLTLAKIARLIGVDQLHVGTAHVGKMSGSSLEAKHITDEIEKQHIEENEKCHILEQEWHGIKPVLAVASGGLSPLSIPSLLKRMGNNIVMQFGGGCHGHPGGTIKGAIAIRQALEASMHNIPLDEYAKAHKELKVALEHWG